MIIFFKILGFFAFLLIAGFSLKELFISSSKRLCLYSAALSFGLGMGFVSLGMFLVSLLGLKFNLFTIGAPWAGLYLAAAYKRLKTSRTFKPEKLRINFSLFGYILIAIIILIVLMNFIHLFYAPLVGWDALVIWNHKAKVFFVDKGIDWSLFSGKMSIFYHREYPLGVSLTETLFYMFLGSFDDTLVKLVFFVFYPCILIILYNLIKRIADKTSALMGIFFFSTIPLLTYQVSGVYCGYADFIYSYFNLISVAYLFLWLINNDKKEFFLISSIFAGLAFWIKLEGAILLSANLLTMFYFKYALKRQIDFKKILRYGLISLAIIAPWLILVGIYNINLEHIPQEGFLEVFGKGLTNIPEAAKHIIKLQFDLTKWNLLWPLFYISLIVLIAFRRKSFLSLLYLNIFLQLGMYFIATVFNRFFLTVLFEGVFRLLFHIIPLAILAFCASISPKLKERDGIIDHSTDLQ